MGSALGARSSNCSAVAVNSATQGAEGKSTQFQFFLLDFTLEPHVEHVERHDAKDISTTGISLACSGDACRHLQDFQCHEVPEECESLRRNQYECVDV